MTIQDVKSWQTRIIAPKPDRPNLNSFALSKAIVALCDKLTDLGVHELRWHDSVQSYQAAVAASKKQTVGEYFRDSLNTLPPRHFFGVTGHDEDQGGKLRTIEFPRIKGGKHFDLTAKWFGEVMDHIGQPYETV